MQIVLSTMHYSQPLPLTLLSVLTSVPMECTWTLLKSVNHVPQTV